MITEQNVVKQLNEDLNNRNPMAVSEVEDYIFTHTLKKKRIQRYRSITVLMVLLMGGSILVVQHIKNLKPRVAYTKPITPDVQILERKRTVAIDNPSSVVNAQKKQLEREDRLTEEEFLYETTNYEQYGNIIDNHLESFNQVADRVPNSINLSDFNNINQPLNN